MMRRLTNKQKKFVETYLTCWNGAEAARQAGYAHPRQSAWETLSNPYIKEYIRQRLTGAAMSADEVLSRLADQARGDIGDFIGKGGVIDLDDAKEKGITHRLKSLSWTKQGIRIEMYSQQHALELIGKHHGLFVDKSEVDISGAVAFNFADNLDDDDE